MSRCNSIRSNSIRVRYAVNCSLIFRELPLLERPAAAAAAGFDAVEFWWPFGSPLPSDDEIRAFERAVVDSGVQLVALNFFAGDLAGPDCGVASIPGRAADFRASVDVAVAIGSRLGVHRFNALYGNRVDGVTTQVQDDLGVESLAAAARATAEIEATVMLEPVSGLKPYPQRTAADALAVIDRVREQANVGNVGLLADFYHMTVNGDNINSVVIAHADDIVHVQIADVPGRHEPGTGSMDLAGHLDELRRVGYSGWVGLEYVPTGASADSFYWLPPDERGAK